MKAGAVELKSAQPLLADEWFTRWWWDVTFAGIEETFQVDMSVRAGRTRGRRWLGSSRRYMQILDNGVLIAVLAHAVVGLTLVWDKILLKETHSQSVVNYVFWLGAIAISGCIVGVFGMKPAGVPVKGADIPPFPSESIQNRARSKRNPLPSEPRRLVRSCLRRSLGVTAYVDTIGPKTDRLTAIPASASRLPNRAPSSTSSCRR